MFMVHGPQQNSELVCQNTKGILHYTPGSGEFVVKYSLLKEGLESPNNIFNLPEEKSLPGDDVPVPYYIVGDNAFGINKRLMNQMVFWGNSEVVGQAWIIVTAGQVSYSDVQLETRRERLSVPCILLLYSAFYSSQDLIVE
jgi:hypothetical protein